MTALGSDHIIAYKITFKYRIHLSLASKTNERAAKMFTTADDLSKGVARVNKNSKFLVITLNTCL